MRVFILVVLKVNVTSPRVSVFFGSILPKHMITRAAEGVFAGRLEAPEGHRSCYQLR